MAYCSKQTKLDFLSNINVKEPTMTQMLEYVYLCRPYIFWDKAKKCHNFKASQDLDELSKQFKIHTDPKVIDNFEKTWKKEFRKKHEAKCRCCHAHKLKEEFRFYETCCRCRNSSVEEDDLEQERLNNSQVCSKCHSRKLFNEFRTNKKGNIYKTCVSCCIKSKPKITPEPHPLPPEAYSPETEPPSHPQNLP